MFKGKSQLEGSQWPPHVLGKSSSILISVIPLSSWRTKLQVINWIFYLITNNFFRHTRIPGIPIAFRQTHQEHHSFTDTPGIPLLSRHTWNTTPFQTHLEYHPFNRSLVLFPVSSLKEKKYKWFFKISKFWMTYEKHLYQMLRSLNNKNLFKRILNK